MGSRSDRQFRIHSFTTKNCKRHTLSQSSPHPHNPIYAHTHTHAQHSVTLNRNPRSVCRGSMRLLSLRKARRGHPGWPQVGVGKKYSLTPHVGFVVFVPGIVGHFVEKQLLRGTYSVGYGLESMESLRIQGILKDSHGILRILWNP